MRSIATALMASAFVALLFGVSTTFAADPPAVTSVVPASAYNTGGDSLTISGTGFAAGATVTIGGVAAQNVVVQSDSVITATTPAAFSVGSVKLRVTNSDGQRGDTAFSYRQAAPTISSVSPNVGPLYGGRPVAINGSGFQRTLRFKDVAASNGFSVGLTYDGKVFAWGNNSYGTFGNGTTVSSAFPVPVSTDGVLAGKEIIAVAAGSNHVLALDSDGRAYSWGSGAGRIGDGTSNASNIPVAVKMDGALAGKKIIAISAGASSSLVVADDGRAYAWGGNGNGQLGDNTTATKFEPTAVNTAGVLAGKTIKSVAMGSTHALAVDTDGVVYSWGYNSSGQLGVPAATTQSYVPVAVTATGVLAGKVIQSVAAGNSISAALDSTGRAYTWGAGALGQMGNNTTTTSNYAPVAVTVTGVLSGKILAKISISGTGNHMTALDTAGVVYTWGQNNLGQLGDNSVTNRTTAVLVNTAGVLSGKVLSAISASDTYTLAVSTDGLVYGWGQNNNNQLGDGTGTNVRVPVATTLTVPLAITATFGGVVAPISSVTSSAMNVVTPAHAAGTVTVSLTGEGVDNAAVVSAYTYTDKPSVLGATPNQLYGTGGDVITITGERFRPGAQVKLGNGPYVTATYVNSTTLQVTSMATSQTGYISITVKNDDDQVGVSETSLRYLRATPNVTSLSPRVGPVIGGQTVTLGGSGFSQNLVFTKVGMGASYACGIADSKPYCWGYPGSGGLGDGQTTTNRLIPHLADVTGALAGKSIIDISTGVSHVVALDSDGKVYAWGSNTNGQLGDGSTTQRNSPVAVDTSGVLAGKRIVAISAGGAHTLALDSDGKVYAWGAAGGRLGNGQASQSPTPVAVDMANILAGKTIVGISAGNTHSAAIDSNGLAYTWGANIYGQLGDNSTTTATTPVAVNTANVLAGKRLVGISAGGEYTVAFDVDGKAYSWGRNNYGQLGINSGNATSQVPAEVLMIGSSSLNGKKVVALEASMLGTSIALDSGGLVHAWGYNSNGQLGQNTTSQTIFPMLAGTSGGVLSGKTIIKIAAGYYGTLAVGNDNTLYAWGSGSSGQLGNGSTSNSLIPLISTTTIALPFTLNFDGIPTANAVAPSDASATVVTPAHAAGIVPVTLTSPYFASAVSQGQYEYIPAPTATSITPNSATLAGGDIVTVSGTGFRSDTQVLFNDTTASVSFVDSTTLQVTVPTGLGAGVVNILVRNVDGQSARLGKAFTYTQAIEPTLTSVSPSSGPATGGNTVTINGAGMTAPVRFTQVATGGLHSCGLTARGAVYCWGYGANGRLGNGALTNSSVPVPVDTSGVLAGKTIASIAVGREFSLALDTDGKVYSWGIGSSGQLGTGTATQSAIPVAVSTTGVLAGKTIKAIAAGAFHSVVVDTDGKVYSWGLASSGQLGNNTSTGYSASPVAVTGGSINGKTITAVAAGPTNSYALDSDGRVHSWGVNTYGQLGNGNTSQYGIPTTVNVSGVLSGKVIASISTGATHVLATDADGKLYAWGRNNTGQLGEGSGLNQSSPVVVDTSGVLAGKTIVHAATGENSSYAIDSTGALYSWGDNTTGQLADGTQTQRTVPVAVSTNIAFAGVNGGVNATTAVGVAYDGSAYGWGANTYGQLGDNSTTTSSLPVLVSKANMTAESAISTLLVDSAAVPITSALETSLSYVAPAHPAGKVSIVAQGSGFSDIQLTDAYEYIAPPVLTGVAPSSGRITGGDTVTLTGSNFSANTIVRIGGVVASVVNQTATTITITTPVNSYGAKAVSVSDTLGQSAYLANGFTYIAPEPSITSISPNKGPVAGGTSVTIQGEGLTSDPQFSQISAGTAHSCGVTFGGKAYCWGLGTNGRLGTGTTANSNTPVPVDVSGVLAGKRIVAISAGDTHTLALDSDGKVYGWGLRSSGQVGDSSMSGSVLSPVAVTTSGALADKVIVKISAGQVHSLALDSDGKVYAWGANNQGRLGTNGSTTANPTAVYTTGVLAGKRIVDISASAHSVAIDDEGVVYTWGYNSHGQLGNGASSTTAVNGVPVVVSSTGTPMEGKKIVSISAGLYHTLALDDTGSVYAWGNNGAGRLGIATSTAQSTVPVAVVTAGSPMAAKKITAISSGSSYSMAVADDGLAYGWGDGTFGRIGDGTASNQGYLPVAVAGDHVFSQLSASPFSGHTCGVAIGAGYCWGINGSFQAGSGQVDEYYTSPRAVSTINLVRDLVVGRVQFGGVDAPITASNATGLVVTAPAHAAGLVDVTLSGASFSDTTRSNAYEYVAPPSISSVTPSTGSVHGGNTVVISGSDFSSGSTVTIGGAAATITGQTSTALTVTTPAHAAGAVSVVVTDSLGQSDTLSNSFTYVNDPPVVESISPSQGPANGGQTVTITGTGFNKGIGNADVADTDNGSVATASSTYPNYAADRAFDGDPDTYWWSNVAPPVWVQSTFSNEYEINRIAWRCGGDNGPATNVQIQLQVNGVWQTIRTLTSAQHATTITGDAIGSFDLETPLNATAIRANFVASPGWVRCSSLNAYSPQATSTLSLGGQLLTDITVSDDGTEITAKTPAGTPGLADLFATNPDGQTTSVPGAYTYIAGPTISTISPSSGSIAGGDMVYISGEHFTQNTTVEFAGNTATTLYVNATTLLVTVPAGVNPGDVDVAVSDEYGQVYTAEEGYTYKLPAPTITSIAPQYAKMSGGATMTITGSGFVNRTEGGSWYEVLVDGQSAEDVAYVNSTTLRFTAPAHELGKVDVVVGGQYSDDAVLADAYTYLPEAYEFANEPRSLMATEPGEFTVRMLDDQGQAVTSTEPISLSLSTTSETGFFARALSGQDAGWDYDSVIIPAGQTTATFYYRDLTKGTPTITVADALNTQTSQQVTINSLYKILVTGISNPTQMGTPSSVTVQAVDYMGVPQSDYRGTIHFTSNDGAATVPGDYTFTASDRGRKTFINGVTMGTMGVWDVTATDTEDPETAGTQEDIVVQAPASGTISSLKFITPSQSFPLDETSGVITVQTQDAGGLAIPVTQATTVYLRTTSSTGQFSSDNGATWATAPAAVTIAAGSSFKNVLYRDTTAGTYELKVSQQAATDFGWQVDTQAVTVGVGAPSRLGLDYSNGGAIGQWVPIDVTLTDSSANLVTSPNDVAVNVSIANGGLVSLAADGSNAATSVSTVILTGQQSVTVWIQTTSEPELSVTATDARDVDEQDKYDPVTEVIQFGDATPSAVTFSLLPSQTTVRTATALQVSLKDQFGNIVAAPSDTEIDVTSQSADASFATTSDGSWSATQTITIAEGTTSSAVYFRHESVNDEVSIQAASGSLVSANEVIRVTAGPYAGEVRFSSATPEEVTAGANTDITVELLDAYGNPTVASTTITIGFGSSHTTTGTWEGVAAVVPNAPNQGHNVTVPAGQGTATATYRDTLSGSATLQAYDQARWVNNCLRYEYTNGPCVEWSAWSNISMATHTLTIKADEPVSYEITSDPQVITKNTASAPITIELQDQFGNPAVFSEASTATITSSRPAGEFALSASGPFTVSQLSFAANQPIVTAYYRSPEVSSQAGDVLTVSGNSLTSATQNLRVIEGFASQAVIDAAGQTTAVAGDIVPLTLRTQTDDGLEVVVLQDTPFALSSTEGEFSLSESPFVPISSVTLSAETSQRQLFYRSTVAGLSSLSARNQQLEPVATDLAIVSSTFYKLGYTKVPVDNLVEVARPSESMVVTAYDEYGNVATPSDSSPTNVGLATSKSAGQFALAIGNWTATETNIPTGATTTQPFYYRIGTIDSASGALTDASVLGSQTITASSDGVLSAEEELRVVGDLANRLVFETAQQSLSAGQTSTLITVQMQNVDGSPAIASADQTINLSSLNLTDDDDFSAIRGNDVFSLSPGGDPITSLTIPAGSSKAQFYVMPQTAESHRIRVSAAVYSHNGGYLRTVSASQPLVVTAGEAAKLAFTSTPQTVHPDKVSGAIKVALTDAYGNTAINETNRTISLESSCETGEFLTTPTGSAVTSIAMGSSENEVVFYYRDTTASAEPCTLTVRSAGLEDATQAITIREPVYALAITSSNQTISAGQTSAPIVVETRDRFGNTVTVEDPLTLSFEATGENYTITPQQRTIATGSSSAQFTFRYDGAVTTPTQITVTAKDAAGVVIATQHTITVVPGAVTGTAFNTANFTAIVGDYQPLTLQALNAYGKRTVATADTSFALATTGSNGAFYRKNGNTYESITAVTIANGTTQSETFYYRQTQATRAMDGANVPATITAQRASYTTASAQATLTAKRLSFSTGSFSAQASAYTPIRATISSPLPSDLTVTLSTSDSTGGFYQSENEDSRVTTAVIPAGETQSEQLYYRQTAETTGMYPEELTVSPVAAPMTTWRGVVRASIYLNQFSELVFVNPPTTLEQGQQATFTVEARDDLGNVVPFTNNLTGYCLYVNSSSSTSVITTTANEARGCVDMAGKKAIYVGRYQTRATFTYQDTTLGDALITAANNAGAGGIRTTSEVAIEDAISSKLGFDRSIYGLVRGDELELSLRLLSAYDYPVNSIGDTVVTLTSDSSTGRFFNTEINGWVDTLQVTIGEGQHTISGLRYTDTTTAASTSIRATADMVAAAQSTINFGVGAVSGLVFKDGPTTLERGQKAVYTIGFVDAFNNESPAITDFCLYLTSTAQGTIGDIARGGACNDVTLPGGAIATAVYVRSGSTQATFSYQTNTSGDVTLQASSLPTGGGITTSRTVSVIDGAPTRVGIEPRETTLERGGVMSGRAVLYNAYDAEVPASQDVAVRLESDFNDGVFALAGDGPWLGSLDLTIPAGSSSAAFLYQTGIEYLGSIVLGASAPNDSSLVGSYADVTVVMGDVAQLVFATPELTTTATHPSEMMTIEAQNRYGVETVVAADLQLYLRSSSPTGVFSTSPTGPWGMSTAKILNGQSQMNMYYRDETVGTHTLTIRDKLSPQEGEEYLVATQQHHVIEQIFSHFIVTNIASPTRAGVASSVVVFAVDSENYVVAGYDGTITFSSDDPTAIMPTGSYTFQPAVDKGIRTFNNGVAFKTSGIKSVTVTDQTGKQGTQFDIEVLDGNTAPVRSISFSDTSIAIEKNALSDRLVLRLHDQAGALTNAPAGGMPLRITSDSGTGQFSTDGSTWLDMLHISIEEGLSFSTTPIYYRDSTGGEHTLTARDWIAATDSPLIENATLAVTVNDIALDVNQRIYSLDYKGEAIENPYLFSRNEQGEIRGHVTVNGVARDIATGDELVSNWSVLVGGTSGVSNGAARLSYQSPTLSPTVGAAPYQTIVSATSGSLASTWQSPVPVSPWRAAIGEIAIDDTLLSAQLSTWSNGEPNDSPQAVVQVLGGVNQVIRTWDLSDLLASGLAQQLSDGVFVFRAPLTLFAGGNYTATIQLSDGHGITAQDAAEFTVQRLNPENPETPTIPGAGGTGDGSGTISPEKPGDTSSRPEPARPTPPRDGAYEQGQQNLITQILKSPETPIRVAQSMLGVFIAIVAILAYQMYREWRHARFLLAVIRRDNETLANKDAFLQLASHHLRTPLTLLSSSSDLLAMNPSEMVKQLNQQLSGVVVSLKAKAEDILARTHNSEAVTAIAVTADEKSARRSVYRKPVFWVPVILTVVLTVAANWAVQTFGGQTIATSTIATQVALLTLGAILLYTAARMLTQRRQQSRVLEQSRAKVQALNRAKIQFAQQVGRELTDDILHATAYIQQLTPVIDDMTKNLLSEGTERLERLVSRFAVLNSVYANTTQQAVVDMEKTVDEALRYAQQQNPAISISIDEPVSPITTRHSGWMVSRLLQDIFASMVPLAGSGVIKVGSRQTKDTTTLTITGPSNHDAPAEDLFSVYSRADEESAGTFSIEAEDNRMHRLDLYLDRMIADELEAELSAKRVGDKMQVTVELPNAA